MRELAAEGRIVLVNQQALESTSPERGAISQLRSVCSTFRTTLEPMQDRRMEAVTALQLVKWGTRIGLRVREIRMLVSELDRFAEAHDVSRRQALEWIGAARKAPGGAIFIAGSSQTVRIANPKVRTFAQRALVNHAKWPTSQRFDAWLDTRPAASK